MGQSAASNAIENNFIFALMPVITGAMKLYDILTTIDGAIEAYDEGGPEALVKYGMEEASINLLMSSSMKFVGKMVNKARLAVKDTFKASSSGASSSASSSAKAAKDVPTPPKKTDNFSAKNVNSSASIKKKLSALEGAQAEAIKVVKLPDGRIRYYEAERASTKPGVTRGASFVTEHNPKTGQVRQWNECYDHNGKVNRVHPKSLDGHDLKGQHYPPTQSELNSFSKTKGYKK
ncbi:MAG: hypothetical protein KF820_03030 [Candidatus Paracaedibacteraceae bacterium]|nr:hypothetical protein [Candidatus Paracaedibacteraceae bacterium]